ncbi:MAG: SAM-dependent methyltransferase, partial [Pseudomonadota bacterium]
YNCLEPACGRGYMSMTLGEYFHTVRSQDVADYGFGDVQDFLEFETSKRWDWVITNPPFRLAEKFIDKALRISRVGCAFLVRTNFVESIGRYDRLFSKRPPNIVAQFSERVPMVKGRLDRKASSASGYCWLVCQSERNFNPEMVWIPPCRKRLESVEDYPT